MAFNTDSQTLEDLRLLGRGEHAVIGLFNRTHTRGGAELLEDMFRYPLSDAASINRRSAIIRYFTSARTAFPFKAELFDQVEQYLSNTDERTRLTTAPQSLRDRMSNFIAEDSGYKTIQLGVMALVEVVGVLRRFIATVDEPAFLVEKEGFAEVLTEPALQPLWEEGLLLDRGKWSYQRIVGVDAVLRFRHRELIRKMLQRIYRLDVYISVGRVAMERGFVFARAVEGESGQLGRPGLPGQLGQSGLPGQPGQPMLRLEGVYHPHLKNPVANSLYMGPDRNLIFLTGANMAGKSTFMKTLGIALFLAHMGFPVPAVRMEFTVFDGIFTTINLPDNLGMGASHFYAEVLRVKKLARELGQGKRLFVILDELFRGTNVKDACEATIAVTGAFAHRTDSMFVISSHIMEAGEVLKERCGTISFQYLPTLMKGHEPVYTYTLEKGITADRHGMVIVENEGIIGILRNGKKKKKSL